MTTVADYPMDEPDIDGFAVGGGFAYLVPDDNDPGQIFVYDLNAAAYVTSLTAPWGATEETFSGAAYISQIELPESQPFPTLSSWALLALMMALMGVGFVTVNRPTV